MIIFLIVQILLFLTGLIIISGHNGLASKFFIATFAFIFIGIFIYLVQIFTEKNEE